MSQSRSCVSVAAARQRPPQPKSMLMDSVPRSVNVRQLTCWHVPASHTRTVPSREHEYSTPGRSAAKQMPCTAAVWPRSCRGRARTRSVWPSVSLDCTRHAARTGTHCAPVRQVGRVVQLHLPVGQRYCQHAAVRAPLAADPPCQCRQPRASMHTNAWMHARTTPARSTSGQARHPRPSTPTPPPPLQPACRACPRSRIPQRLCCAAVAAPAPRHARRQARPAQTWRQAHDCHCSMRHVA